MPHVISLNEPDFGRAAAVLAYRDGRRVVTLPLPYEGPLPERADYFVAVLWLGPLYARGGLTTGELELTVEEQFEHFAVDFAGLESPASRESVAQFHVRNSEVYHTTHRCYYARRLSPASVIDGHGGKRLCSVCAKYPGVVD